MSNKVKVSLAAIFLIFGAWFFLTPYLTVIAMRSAAEARDSAKLSGYVNFPVLKENLKTTLNVKFTPAVIRESDNPLAAMGASIAAALISPMADALVTPESLALIMKGNRPQPGQIGAPSPSSDSNVGSDIETSMAYESFNRFVFTVKKKGEAAEPVGFVFHREDLFSWKLSAIRLSAV